MTREEVAEGLRTLPPAEAAQLLRELLEYAPVSAPPPDQWLGTVDRVIRERIGLLRRLAER